MSRGIQFVLLCTALLWPGATLAEDEVHLVDGRVIKGRVVDGGLVVRVIKPLGSIQISKRDIVKIEMGEETPSEGTGLDRVIFLSGEEIEGKVRLEKGGEIVVITGKLGEIKHPRSEIREIIFARPAEETRKLGEGELRRRVQGLLDAMDDPERAKEAEEELLSLLAYAAPHLEEELSRAEGDRRRHIERLLGVNRLRSVLTLPIEATVPSVYDRLLSDDPKVRSDILREIVLYHVDDCVPLLVHVLKAGETDPDIRGYVIAQLGKMARNAELIDLMQTGDPQVQLASAMALGENGIYLGVPILIQALGVEDEGVRRAVFEKLKQFTGEHFLYSPLDPKPGEDPDDPVYKDRLAQARQDRTEAIARWNKWWEAKGEELVQISMKEFRKGIVTPEEKEEAEKFFAQGSEILDRLSTAGDEPDEEEILRGIYLLRSALEKDPGLGKARLHLAILHYLRGERSDLLDATSQLRAITERYETESGPRVLILAHYYLGRIRADGHTWEQARLHYEDAIRVDADFVDGYLALGEVIYRRAVFEEEMDEGLRRRLLDSAVRRFEEALEAIKRNYESLKDASKELSLIRGSIPYRGGSFKIHLRDYNTVLRAKSALIHFRKGMAFVARGNYADALTEFRTASQKDPDEPDYAEAVELWGDRLETPPSD